MNLGFINRNLLWYNKRIKGGFLLWIKQYLNKWTAHTPCRAITNCQRSYCPKKNTPSACGDNAAYVIKEAPQNPVLQSAHFRKTSLPPCRCRGGSAIPPSSAGQGIRRAGGLDRTAESRKPNRVGREDELHS